MAAGGLAESYNLNLITAIDERSAAFLALGISTASGKAAAVITTSGSAVGNLLPAAIEADRSCQPLLFLTADRPERLKNCGANQTVNQEEFLRAVCRSVEEGPSKGLHLCSEVDLKLLADRSWQKCHEFPGPVHFNLPFEEPLHASFAEQKNIWENLKTEVIKVNKSSSQSSEIDLRKLSSEIPKLDFSSPGIVIAGPWRGLAKDLFSFRESLRIFQSITSWAIFADPLSGIEIGQPGLIFNWEILLNLESFIPNSGINVLRLGPLPSSRILEKWLFNLRGRQILITEGDHRYLDPLGLSEQWSYGLSNWCKSYLDIGLHIGNQSRKNSIVFFNELISSDRLIDNWIQEKFKLEGLITEPSLAHWIPKLLPSNFSKMLSASSPVRDWISFSGSACFQSRCFSFRGASGIDGTLSLAMGLSIELGPMILVTGDLALFHDTNGWLFSHSYKPPLIIFLIDNGGGGIFNQLGLEKFFRGSFKRLFSMPQMVDPLKLVSAYGIPSRQISCLEDLPRALEWGISINGPVLLRVSTCPEKDKDLRKELQVSLKEHLRRIIQDEGA